MLDKGTPTSGEGISGDGLINPSQFPAKSVDMYPSQIEESATRLRAMGKSVRAQVGDIDSSWGRLKGHYEAPEQQRVYDLMDPAVRSARDLKSTLSKAAGHLDVYASALRCLKPRLEKLEKDANDFRARVSGGVTVDASDAKDASFGDLAIGGINWVADQEWIPRNHMSSVSERQVTVPWNEHDPSVQENNALVARLHALIEDISRAATTCANDVNDLVESWSPSDKKPMTAEALSAPGQKPMPWGSIVEEDRNCPEAVGHGNGLAARAAGEELQGIATLAVGYNPDTGGIFDLGAAHRARMGLADVGLSTVVTIGARNLRTPEGSVPWLDRRRDVAATAWGEAIGYDHQAQKQYGNGFHEWKDDSVAMTTKTAWTVVPALLTAGWGGAAKGGLSATGKAAKGVPDGAPKKVPESWRTGVNSAPLARLDADIEARGKAYPSGHGQGKATNGLLDAVDDAPTPQKSPDAPVSNSINTDRGIGSAPDGSGGRGAGDAPSNGRPQRGSDTSGSPKRFDPEAEPRTTVRAGEAPEKYRSGDVEDARSRPSKIGSFTVPDDAVRVTSGSKGNWEHSLYNPEPNKTYMVDDKFAYVTDEQGRVKEAHGILEDAPRDGAGHRQTKAGGVDRLDGDEGGHIFGKSLGGPGEDINLLAMSRDANRSQYAKLENEWRALLKENPPPKIEATVKPMYDGDSRRPSRFVVEWTKDGVPQDDTLIRNN